MIVNAWDALLAIHNVMREDAEKLLAKGELTELRKVAKLMILIEDDMAECDEDILREDDPEPEGGAE